jgi:glycosyltransferase involved in cell wall biosynthesis
MPTANRRAFVPQAIRYFLAQDYPNKELVILDDGSDSVADLVPEDPQIRYLRLTGKRTLGDKRNECVEASRGEIILHWDDDDWQAPHRIRYQVEALLQSGAEACGSSTLLFYEPSTGCAWRYVYPAGQRFWLSGNTLCYRRSFWFSNRFPSVNVGEDARFVWSGRPERMLRLEDAPYHVGLIHPNNASPKQTTGVYWQPHSVEEIRRLLGTDWTFYSSSPSADVAPPAVTVAPIHERNVPVFTVAKAADLVLPEFVAFNHGQTLPWMRRWELPFALFQSRLSATMSVLDCTINPVNFHNRLACLYPDIHYRHCNPIQSGRFVLPFGVPDEAFDRVLCINTLEHLLRSQRATLIAALARKLKPGGLLVLTSDYYFDSSWSNPAFLQAGVMRADRQEIINGWNKVRPAEWCDLCRQNDLHPLAEPCEEPREDDPTLYRNQLPHPHACIAGVFSKAGRVERAPGRKVVLALLTWNTRAVSLDSVRAYMREARMLGRLGQIPLLCVCDNGSTDGTAEALRALEPEIDVPYTFIFNARNAGNSIARNQIVECMRKEDADYVLFMDGDIEVVPFSSFAMLRYMENCGHQLGCIGADSGGQTPYRERASPCLYSVAGLPVDTTNLVAWTQYGMFRRVVFEAGVRFDETSPFDGPGWGFEDNDLAFQMETKGYLNQRFYGLTYLHRAARSSIRIMRQSGIDTDVLYARRKQYIIDKWSHDPRINNGPLAHVRRVVMPR